MSTIELKIGDVVVTEWGPSKIIDIQAYTGSLDFIESILVFENGKTLSKIKGETYTVVTDSSIGRVATISDEIIEDYRKFLSYLINNYIMPVKEIPNDFEEVKRLVSDAIRYDYRRVKFAPERLKSDREFVISAIKDSCGLAFIHVDDTFTDDKDIAMLAVKLDSIMLDFVSDRLKDDVDVVMEAVMKKGRTLEYASARLRDNEEIVSKVVCADGLDLKWASDRLRDNKEIVLSAVKQDSFAIRYVSERLRDDEEIILLALKRDRGLLKYASERLQNKFKEEV